MPAYRPFTFSRILAVVVLFLLFGFVSAPAESRTLLLAPDNPVSAPNSVPVSTALRSSPIMFIENIGQFDPQARFQVRGNSATIHLTQDALWYTLLEKQSTKDTSRSRLEPRHMLETQGQTPRRGVNLKLSFVDANPQPQIEPFNRLDTAVSFFKGKDSTKWQPDVPVWGGVRYKDLYPGIDLEMTSENGQMVQRLVTQPNADLNMVRLRVEGADQIALEDDHLTLHTTVGDFTLPLLQAVDADRKLLLTGSKQPRIIANEITAPFVARSLPVGNQKSDATSAGVSFLVYSTFLGGSGDDGGISIVVDNNEAAYIAGLTESYNFPTTPGTFDGSFNGYTDAFVLKLNPAGSALVYATFLGGSAYDYSVDLAVDASGAAYVTGYSNSYDFPTTAGAYQYYKDGGYDAFVAKLNPTGSALVYSTFLGGFYDDGGIEIEVDANGAAYVVGQTLSYDFPTTFGAFDRTYNGNEDVFVAKLNATGSDLVYATFVGGSGNDCSTACSIAVDGNGAAYITGDTNSSNFPTTPGAYDTTSNGGYDVFVAKLNAAGSALVYTTFVGGNSYDVGVHIVVDGSGAAYVTGQTYSANFPVTPGAFDTTYNTGGFGGDAFVVKLNPAGSSLIYSTFLGGSDFDQGITIAVDGSGAAYITGASASPDFPTTPGAIDTTYNGNGDAFVVKLNTAGSALVYATFLGGSGNECTYNCTIAIDGNGVIYIAGVTESSNFPTTPGAFDRTFNGGNSDEFVAKLVIDAVPRAYLPLIAR